MGIVTVGSEVEAYCTKCKLMLDHTVKSMQMSKPRRVVCKTCGGEHNYRKSKPKPRASTKKAGGAKSKARGTRQSWDEILKEASSKPHKAYKMSGSFGEGDWIEHSTFGLGCIQSYTAPNKIKVRFADSTRLLICNQP